MKTLSNGNIQLNSIQQPNIDKKKKKGSQLNEKNTKEANTFGKQMKNVFNSLVDIAHSKNKEQLYTDDDINNKMEILCTIFGENLTKWYNVYLVKSECSNNRSAKHYSYICISRNNRECKFKIDYKSGKLSIKDNKQTFNIFDGAIYEQIIDFITNIEIQFKRNKDSKITGVEGEQKLFNSITDKFDKDEYEVKQRFRKGNMSIEIKNIKDKTVNFIIYFDILSGKVHEYDENFSTEICNILDSKMVEKIYERFLIHNANSFIKPQSINNSHNIMSNNREKDLNLNK